MVETITTATISVASVLLFAYWFRYSCLLILSAQDARNFAAAVITEHQLTFAEVQAALQTSAGEIPQHLHDALDRDYATLQGILQKSGGISLEGRMVAAHYKIMSTLCRVSSSYSPAAARRALDEMAQVVAHMANTVGELAASPSAA